MEAGCPAGLRFLKDVAMFAVIKTGGKQYRVQENNIIKVEKVLGEVGDTFRLDDVLMIETEGKLEIGKPKIEGAQIEATIVAQMRDRKIIVFKKIRRHNYRRKHGHRQALTVLKINKIVLGKK